MQYTYLDGSNVYIYPSANAEDGGNINKEVNIAGLVTSVIPTDFIVSYKLKDPNVAHESLEVDLAAGLSSTEFNLYSGQVVLNGRSVELSFDPDGTNYQTFDLSTLYDGTIGTASALYLLVVPFFAASGNILGDSYQNVNDVVTRECRGVALTAVDSLTGLGLDHYVVVGKFDLTSGSITSYTAESNSYRPISFDSIKDANKYLGKVYQTNTVNAGYHAVLFREPSPHSGTNYVDLQRTRYDSRVYYGTTGTKGILHLDNNVFLELTTGDITVTGGSANTKLRVKSYLSSSSGGDSSKVFTQLPNSSSDNLSSWSSQTVFVRFSESNTATGLSINDLSLKLLDGRSCPWYAISEVNNTYQLKFIYDSTTPANSYWILLNPSAPVVKCQYIYDNSGTPDTSCKFTMYWKELQGQVSGVIYTSDTSTSVSTLPVGKYNIDDSSKAPPTSIPRYPKGSMQVAVYCGTYALYLSAGLWVYLPQTMPAHEIEYTLPGEVTTRKAYRQFAFKYMIS